MSANRVFSLALALALLCAFPLTAGEAQNAALAAWLADYNKLASEHDLSQLSESDAAVSEAGNYTFICTEATLVVGFRGDAVCRIGLYFENFDERVIRMAACCVAVTGDKRGYEAASALLQQISAALSKSDKAQGSVGKWSYKADLSTQDARSLWLTYDGAPEAASSGGIWDGLFPDEGETTPAPSETPKPTPKPEKPVYKA